MIEAMSDKTDQYSDEETVRRRDMVIRRMANTPPQPRAKPSVRRPGKQNTIASHRLVRKDGAGGKP